MVKKSSRRRVTSATAVVLVMFPPREAVNSSSRQLQFFGAAPGHGAQANRQAANRSTRNWSTG